MEETKEAEIVQIDSGQKDRQIIEDKTENYLNDMNVLVKNVVNDEIFVNSLSSLKEKKGKNDAFVVSDVLAILDQMNMKEQAYEKLSFLHEKADNKNDKDEILNSIQALSDFAHNLLKLIEFYPEPEDQAIFLAQILKKQSHLVLNVLKKSELNYQPENFIYKPVA